MKKKNQPSLFDEPQAAGTSNDANPLATVSNLTQLDNEGLRLLKELQSGNVLYQGDYLPRPDYIVLMRRLLGSSNEQDYRDAYSELCRQQTQLQELIERTSVKPALTQATRDECWQLLECVHDWFRASPPPHGVVFWYGALTGYPNELVRCQDYLARATACLESGEAGRIYAAMTAMQRTLESVYGS